MSIYSEVASFLSHYEKNQAGEHIAEGGETLVIGVSGGPDSVTLLHVLAQRGLYDKSQLIVAHLNHRLRPSAEQDAAYVKRLASEWGLAYHQSELDVADLARQKGLGIEHAGRVARYRFLASIADLVGARAILTAHTADDQVETVLMHLLRGTGLAGLRGILPIAPNPEAPQQQILRPMLNVWREEVIAYCDNFGLEPAIDPTNLDVSFFRNRIRNNLIPYLLDYNPGVRRNLHNLAALTLADYDELQGQVGVAWLDYLVSEDSNEIRIDLLRWRSASLGLRRNMIKFAWSKLCTSENELSFRALELVRKVGETGSTGATVDMPAGVIASLEYDHLTLIQSIDDKPIIKFPQIQDIRIIPLGGPSTTPLNYDWFVQTEPLAEFEYNAIENNADPWMAFICIDRIDELVIRPRITGENFRPLGMDGHSKKVSKLMIDEKIPASYRERWPLLATNSQVLWIAGHQLDERVQITPECKNVIRIHFRRTE